MCETVAVLMNAELFKPISPELESHDVDERSVLAFSHGFPSPLVRWHGHDEYELHLIVEGSGKIYVGDHVGSFKAQQLVMLGPRQPHNWVSDNIPGEKLELRDYVIQFRRDLITSMARSAPELNALLSLLERSQRGIEFTGPVSRQSISFFERMIDSDQITRIALLLEFLGILNRETRFRILSTSVPEAHQTDTTADRITQITRYIAENYAQDLPLSQLADISGMSESAFSRFFARSTGLNFNRYLNRLRIARACELLGEGELPITDICHDVGFHNVANFNRHFREHKSMTPREYRKQTRLRYSAPSGSSE